MKTAYNVGIYCRLSREDNKNDESMSIANQKTLLKGYVLEKGWSVYKIYVDDGISGTTFDRPEFQQMIQDIEDGKVNCVITKDLSRLGRNYIEAGTYRERFLERNVRYIAVNDNYDSELQNGDILSIAVREVMNEMYAQDISRKVRSTKKTMAEQGKFANSRAPYGYLKSPENKHILIVDDNVSQNIVRIFELYISGVTGRAIAQMFNSEGILPPNEYYYKTVNKPNPYRNNKNSWGSASIMNIVKNPAYYGAMSNGKRTVTSFKNKRIVRKSIEDWVIVENTHEPIISKDTWLEAQRINSTNKKETVRRSADGEVSVFAGVVKCADCGGNMVFNRKTYKTHTHEFFRCSTYQQKGKEVCSMHKLDYDILYDAVLADIQRYATLAIEDEQKLIDKILKSNNEFKAKNLSRYEKNIRESKSRIRKIDGLIQAMIEDRVSGNISGEMLKRMSSKYENEQRQLEADLEQLEIELVECQKVEQDLSSWIKRIRECLSLDTITRAIAVELIDRIEVSEQYDEGGEKFIDVNIFYKFGLKSSDEKENRAC